MDWKHAYRSFYYETLADIPDVDLPRAETALLIVDVQNVYFPEPPDAAADENARLEWARWQPFRERMQHIVVPATRLVLEYFRRHGMDVFFARIASLRRDGRDRSLSQRRPGFNNVLLPAQDYPSQIIDALAPAPDEIIVTKTTDSALTGTNLRLVLHNMGIRHVVVTGIFTDQCISSTVRSLADESFNVVVLDDCCAAATDRLHRHELEIINNIYCQVMRSDEVIALLEQARCQSG